MTAIAKSQGLPASADAHLADLIDELTARLKAGEAVDLEACLAAHQADADELRRLFPALRLLADLSRSGPEAAADGPAPPLGDLGDFRLVREIGRGGMGVVYEAEQVSLRRRVALKVLPFAGMMDPRHLQRFLNEAQAAACLHHTNIVPVFFVGSERGVHFYAMQLIEGRTLAAIVHELAHPAPPPPPDAERTTPYNPAAPPAAPGGVSTAVQAGTAALSGRGKEHFRAVARLGAQAAEALDYAHQMGVVHRDVKPGNLMLDGRGNLWVTDFGLAHFQHGEAGLTMTGDLVGTLRYMSPEQALAKRVVIDHRTDIYSLGATLYELLTLRPTFGGEDRQELLRQIAFEDPKPPRRISKAIPAELETIVLKALEKNAQDRYATAQELADDLGRFLEDKPIRARRPSLYQRATKWGRRHQGAVLIAAVVSCVVALILAGSTAWVWRADRLKDDALAANDVALGEKEQALSERTQALQQAQEQEQAAKRNAIEAGRQQARADNNFRQAIEEISQLVKAADDPGTGRTPLLEEVRKAQSDRSLAFYQRLLQENRTDPAGRLQTGLVYRELLVRYAMRGDTAKAMEAYDQAVALFKQLTIEFPRRGAEREFSHNPVFLFNLLKVEELSAEARYQVELIRTHVQLKALIQSSSGRLASREQDGGHHKEAAKFYEQAATMSEALTTEQPDDTDNWFTLGVATYWAGHELWVAGQTKEAEALFSKAW